ncbi:MAG: hypothetical protein AB7P23_09775, partial [Amphiplicatus sp.]
MDAARPIADGRFLKKARPPRASAPRAGGSRRRPAPASETDETERPFIIVGGGPSGARAAQELAALCERRIQIFSDERWGSYNRVKLTPFLAREVNLGQVCQSLDLATAARVERIDC